MPPSSWTKWRTCSSWMACVSAAGRGHGYDLNSFQFFALLAVAMKFDLFVVVIDLDPLINVRCNYVLDCFDTTI